MSVIDLLLRHKENKQWICLFEKYLLYVTKWYLLIQVWLDWLR